MSADLLREAAAKMRERAEEPVAQPERWPNFVAPALADLLDAMHERFDREALYEHPGSQLPFEAAALRVARAYLNDNTDTTGGTK